MTKKHDFIPRWDKYEKGYYCKVCGTLKECHRIFDLDEPKPTDEELDLRWKKGLSVPFHPGMKLTVTFASGPPPTTSTIRVRVYGNEKQKTQS